MRAVELGGARASADISAGAKALQAAEDWLIQQQSLCERRLDQIDSYLLALKEKEG